MRRQAGRALEQPDELVLGDLQPGAQFAKRERFREPCTNISAAILNRIRSRGAGSMRAPPLPCRANSAPKLVINNSRSSRLSRPSSSARCSARKFKTSSRSESWLRVKYGTVLRPRLARSPRWRPVPGRTIDNTSADSPHPARMRLARIEDEQCRGVSLLGNTAALHHGTAKLGCGDDQCLMAMRCEFLCAEIGVHQAQSRRMAIPPVPAIFLVSTRAMLRPFIARCLLLCGIVSRGETRHATRYRPAAA